MAAAGCAEPRTPEAVAEAFIDRYYIERDPKRALALATGVAASRVADETRLVNEGQAAGAGVTAVNPHIYYKRRRTVPHGADLEQSFDLSIDSGGVMLRKDLRVVTTSVQGVNKVSFFNESDAP